MQPILYILINNSFSKLYLIIHLCSGMLQQMRKLHKLNTIMFNRETKFIPRKVEEYDGKIEKFDDMDKNPFLVFDRWY